MAVPTSVYTPFTLTPPNRPGGSLWRPSPDDVDRLQHPGRVHQPERHVRSNEDYLDTDYQGVGST